MLFCACASVSWILPARAENEVLQVRVRELTSRVKHLTVENESLKAEVEMYRKEMAVPNFSRLALGGGGEQQSMQEDNYYDDKDQQQLDGFVRSGNDDFPKWNEISFFRLHGPSNNLTCALSPDDVILASGGADAMLRLVPWGGAESNNNMSKEDAASLVVQHQAASIRCPAPAIAVAFSPVVRNVLAVGCMDGSVALVHYQLSPLNSNNNAFHTTLVTLDRKHVKYIRNVAWSTKDPILATSSADGCIFLYKVEKTDDISMQDDDDDNNNNYMNGVALQATLFESLHLSGPVEAICFVEDYLICYIRGTPHLTFFDLSKDMKQTRVNLNQPRGDTAGFASDHVSFAILDLRPCPQGNYLAAATDTSRNLILELSSRSGGDTVVSCRIIRDLYGHVNDGFSQPKVAWSLNGQYLLGNSQDEAVICVWDIASQQLVQRLPMQRPQQHNNTAGPTTRHVAHTSPIRDMCTGHSMNVLVSTAFDRSTRFWFPE